MAEAKKMKLSVNILPPEIIEKIFKLFKYKDLCQAQLICRRWNDIIKKLKTKGAGKTLTTGCLEGNCCSTKMMHLPNCV